MRIEGFHVDGFGLLHGLEVEGLPPGITVVLGPNETGKSTLHIFLVRTLFGHPRANDARGRSRHEPLRGGRHGGVVHARDDDGERWSVHRYTTGTPVLRVVTPSGAESTSPDAAAPLLGRGMDADRYEQVFAIDLDSLAGLGGLGDGALDELLLDAATVGAGRSLRTAIARLEQRRDQLWAPRGRKPALNAAMAARREAEGRLRSAREVAASYAQARQEVEGLAAEVARLGRAREELAGRMRELQLLVELWPTWQERVDARARLEELGDVEVPDALHQRVTRLTADRDALADRAEEAREAAAAAEQEARAITVNEHLHAVAERVEDHAEGLAVQRDRRQRLAQADTEVATAVAAAEEALAVLPEGWGPDRVAATSADPGLQPVLRRTVDRLRIATGDRDAADRAHEMAQRALTTSRQAAEDAAAAVGGQPQGDVDARQAAVAALRGLLPQLERQPVGASATPARWPVLLAGLLTLGLLGIGVVAWSAGPVAVGAAVLAAAAVAGAVTVGVWWSTRVRSVTGGRPDAGGRRVDGDPATSVSELDGQVAEAAAVLGLRPPVTLQQVEQAALESERLAEAQRQHHQRAEQASQAAAGVHRAEQAAVEAAQQRVRCAEELDAAIREWRRVAARAGLDPDTDPEGAAELLTAVAEARRDLAALERSRRSQQQLAKEVEAFDARTRELLAAAGETAGDHLDGALARLVERCREDADERARRDRLEAAVAGHRRQATELERAGEGKEAELTATYAEVGVVDADGFVAARAASAQRRQAQEVLERADATLLRRLGTDADAAMLRAELADGRVTAWADESAEAVEREQALTEERDAVLRAHTTATQALTAIGTDDAVVRAATEVEELTERCRELAARWATTDLAARMLTATLERFERAHQPAVLDVAGRLLARATTGRWSQVRRIDDELFVAAGGDPVPAGVLSRGATEQLYLCLRLALADELNRHQARLPLLIDDLMANADPARADGLAGILAEVAARQQVMVFTCNPTTAARVVDADPAARVLELSADSRGRLSPPSHTG